jgi:nucleotide-binding universal stress UspA family protein
VIVPSHGRQGLKRLLLGSVAEAIVRQVHCPILVVKQT